MHDFLGLKVITARADLVVGRLEVTEAAMQPQRLLHGGVSALIAESLASEGACISSQGPVVGVELNCSHLRGAPMGATVIYTATLVRAGRTLQVWEVRAEQEQPTVSQQVVAPRDSSNSTEKEEDHARDLARKDKVLLFLARITLAVRGKPEKTSHQDLARGQSQGLQSRL